MRKTLIIILLAASVALPAMAQDRRDGQPQPDAQEASGRGDEARPERAQRAERPQIIERAIDEARSRDDGQQAVRPELAPQQYQQPQQPPPPEERPRGGERRDGGQRWSGSHANPGTLERQQSGAGTFDRGQVVPRGYGRREERVGDGSIVGRAIEQSRTGTQAPWVNHDGRGDGGGARDDGHRHDRPGLTVGWSNEWRADRNYDWRRYRDRNQTVFQLGNYWDPYRSSYRRFSIGFSLWPDYYQPSYWLDDPWMYRLPQTYGPYRWVRYYHDALLVNVYTGQVVDVVYSFFW